MQLVTDVLEETRGQEINSKPLIFTIGHSTRPLDEFIGLLQAHGVKQLVDVRTIPRSRHIGNSTATHCPPHCEASASATGHMKGLGGLRHPRKDSPQRRLAQRQLSRGFADDMQTDEFEENLERLIALAAKKQIAIMCAEAVPWRCHRSLISDALTVRGIPVEHITSRTPRQAHKLTAFAKLEAIASAIPPEADPDLPSLRDTLQ